MYVYKIKDVTYIMFRMARKPRSSCQSYDRKVLYTDAFTDSYETPCFHVTLRL